MEISGSAAPALGSSETELLTMPKKAEARTARQELRIGVPREVSRDECRVALAPSGAATLVAEGHQVVVERGAGEDARFSDEEYADAGALLVSTADEVWRASTTIAKVGPPSPDECQQIDKGTLLFSALHLGSLTPDFIHCLVERNVTAVGYEFIREADGSLPIVRMMHEIMGSMSIQIAARYLETSMGGKGVMLGGISGVPPARVVVLGAGVVGEWAARTAVGYGAQVTVLDRSLTALRQLELHLDRRVTTAMASPHYVRSAVAQADVVIGAMMGDDERSPVVVTEDLVERMRSGAVIVDAVIDQGGCVETSRPTTHSDPVFTVHGVTHYCVPNIPSNAARTSTLALSNVLVPYLLQLGEASGVNDALWRSGALRTGTYVYRRHLTKKALASMLGLPHRDIELLVASGL
jgi:alanine dehydrogenase